MRHIGIVGDAGVGKDTIAQIICEEKHNAYQYAFADPLKDFCVDVFDIPRKYFDDQALKNDTKLLATTESDYAFCQIEKYVDLWIRRDPKFNHNLIDPAFTTMAPRTVELAQEISDRIDYQFNLELSVSTGTHLTPRKIMQRVGTEVFRGMFGDQFWANIKYKQILDNAHTVVFSDVRFESELDFVQSVEDNVVILIEPVGQHINKAAGHSSETLVERVKEETSLVENLYVFRNEKSGLQQLRNAITHLMDQGII